MSRRKPKPQPQFFATYSSDPTYSPSLGCGATPEEAIEMIREEYGDVSMKNIRVYEVQRAGCAQIIIEWDKK